VAILIISKDISLWYRWIINGSEVISSSILPVDSFDPSAIYKSYGTFFLRVSKPTDCTSTSEMKFLDALESIITIVL